MTAKKFLIGLLAIINGFLPSVEAATSNLNSTTKTNSNKSSIKSQRNITLPKKKNSIRNISLVIGGIGLTAGGIILYRKQLVDYFTNSFRNLLVIENTSLEKNNLSSVKNEKNQFKDKDESDVEDISSESENEDESDVEELPHEDENQPNLGNFSFEGENQLNMTIYKGNIQKYVKQYPTVEKKAEFLRRRLRGTSAVITLKTCNKKRLITAFRRKKYIYDSLERLDKLEQDEKKDKESVKRILKFIPYLSDEVISEAQQEAYNNINKELQKNSKLRDAKGLRNYSEMGNYFYVSNPICSQRKENGENPGNLTKVEKALDEAVDKGDLPLETITLKDIELVYDKYKETGKKGKPSFILKKGVDSLNLDYFASGEEKHRDNDINIVQLASQFNGLEAPSANFSPVKNWIDDCTQGPRAALQSIAGAKHRESAYLKGKLPDEIKHLINGWKKTYNKGSCYKDLYEAGYLQLSKINDKDDLQFLKFYLQEDIREMNFLCQWVKCDFSEQLQLQAFNAAPSFQGLYVNWSSNDEVTNLKKEICELLVSSQYKALAQIAVIKARMSPERTVNLHLTLIGQGVFNNPQSVITRALEEVKRAVEGTGNIRIFLHGFDTHKDIPKWETAIKKNNMTFEKRW